MNTLLQDLRYGIRMLMRSPGFAAIAILTLALGIGANTAIFSLIDAALLHALPVANPSQLVVLKWSAHYPPNIQGYMSAGDCASDLRFGAINPSGCSFSEPMFRKIEQSGDFNGVTAFGQTGRLDLSGNGPATVINGQLVSGEFFHTLGVTAALGRVLESSDDTPTAAPVAVLNYGYWQSAFGGSRDVIGRTIQLDNVPFKIVGVADQKFTGLSPGSDFDVWLPLSDGGQITGAGPWQNRQADVSFWWLTIVARLKTNTPVLRAQAAVTTLFRNETLHGSVPLFGGGGMMGGGPPMPGGGGAHIEMRFSGGPPPGGAGGVPGMPPGPPPGAGNGPVVMGGPPPGGAQGKHIIMGGPPSAGQGPAITHGPQGAPGGAPPGGQFFNVPIPGAGGKAPATSSKQAKAAPGGGPGGPGMAGAPQTLSQPADNPQITLVPAQSGLTGARRRVANPLYVLMFAVGIILLIACANVAGLMLARSSVRQKEMAVRMALGAARGRIMRQLLTESMLLSVCGGVLGIIFAYWGAHAIVSFVSKNQTRPLSFASGVDVRVLWFTIAVSLLTGILFGIAPAFRGTRIDLTPALKEGEGGTAGVGGGGRKWFSVGNALVVAQVGLAMVVLVVAGLLVRTLVNLRSVDLGFNTHNILNFSIDPTLAGFTPAQVDSFYRDLQGRLAETPGVLSASYSQMPLLSGGLMATSFHWPGTPQDQQSTCDVLSVGPDFFATMHIPLLVGRGFTATDFQISAGNHGTKPTAAPTPVMVNQTFVEKFLGKENPLGKQFGQSGADANGPGNPGYEIIGVVGDAKYNNLRSDIQATMYQPQSGGGASFELRTAANPQAILPAIRKVVAQVNSSLPLFNVVTESEQIDRLLFQERLIARLSTFFGVLALILACVGLYGLLAYDVARRTREIGIRMALGAQQGSVLRLIVGQGIVLAIAGAIVGIGAALGVTRYLGTLLYGVHPGDPATFAAVTILLVAVALAACYIPARRATRVDPMEALRYE